MPSGEPYDSGEKRHDQSFRVCEKVWGAGNMIEDRISVQELVIGNTHIMYNIVYRPRRLRVALQISLDGTLTVLAPRGYPLEQVQMFVEHNRSWIAKHYKKYQDYPPKTFVDGDQFLLGGSHLTLCLRAGTALQVIQHNDQLFVDVPRTGRPDTQIIRQRLIAWYRQEAAITLLPRLNTWAGRIGWHPTRVKIHEYRSRWGYCREDGLIALNWRIIQAPCPVMDYVLVHELMHLKHPDHQKGFWQALADVLPEYGQAKQWLKNQGYRLQW